MSTTTTNINKSSYVITNGSIAGDHKSTACSEKPLLHANEAEEELEHVDEDDLFVLRRFVPGSIAEREYKKWYNAVDMPNNPYAPDALKRRISGSQEKFIDLPNISPSTEQNPITLMESTSAAATSAIEEREQSQERDYKRYSRDYYINDVKAQQHEASKKPHNTVHSNSQESVDIIINEVNSNGRPNRVDDNRTSNASDNDKIQDSCHWTLSTPIRRSSSLKYLSNRSPKLHYFNTNSPIQKQQPTPPPLPQTPPPYAATMTSRCNSINDLHYHQRHQNSGIDSDTRSQHSWKSSTPNLGRRRTNSSLSCYRNSGRSQKQLLPTVTVLTQFEKQLLHKDLKRNSFRAISATTKDFVLNPIFDSDEFYGNGHKLSLTTQADDPTDSGVDSCLNGFSEHDAKISNNSLLF